MKLGIADPFGICQENDEGDSVSTQAYIRAVEEPFNFSSEEMWEDVAEEEENSHTRVRRTLQLK